MPDPGGAFVTERGQLPDTAHPRPVQGLEVLRILIVTAELGYSGHSGSWQPKLNTKTRLDMQFLGVSDGIRTHDIQDHNLAL